MLITEIPTIYINLQYRTDRNENALNELRKIGITTPERFNAIENENGAIGCSLSHIKCLEIAIERNYDYVLICEDDIEIVYPKLLYENVNKFLNSKFDWDVVLLGGNNMIPYNLVVEYCIKIYNCLTTTAYIVKKSYFKTLLNHYKEGVIQLMREPTQSNYRIDKYWLKLQQKDKWYMLIPPSVIQKEDYSDIEKRVTNFRNYMLDFNKAVRK